MGDFKLFGIQNCGGNKISKMHWSPPFYLVLYMVLRVCMYVHILIQYVDTCNVQIIIYYYIKYFVCLFVCSLTQAVIVGVGEWNLAWLYIGTRGRFFYLGGKFGDHIRWAYHQIIYCMIITPDFCNLSFILKDILLFLRHWTHQSSWSPDN